MPYVSPATVQAEPVREANVLTIVKSPGREKRRSYQGFAAGRQNFGDWLVSCDFQTRVKRLMNKAQNIMIQSFSAFSASSANAYLGS